MTTVVISTAGRNLYCSTQSVFPKLPMDKIYFVYLLTNWNNKVMYVGVTNNLERRLYEHKRKLVEGFTRRYNVGKLVYFESTPNALSAIEREKQIKKWRREKKNQLVESANPAWEDLSLGWGKDFSLRSK
jgi:putative endonuclease